MRFYAINRHIVIVWGCNTRDYERNLGSESGLFLWTSSELEFFFHGRLLSWESIAITSLQKKLCIARDFPEYRKSRSEKHISLFWTLIIRWMFVFCVHLSYPEVALRWLLHWGAPLRLDSTDWYVVLFQISDTVRTLIGLPSRCLWACPHGPIVYFIQKPILSKLC